MLRVGVGLISSDDTRFGSGNKVWTHVESVYSPYFTKSIRTIYLFFGAIPHFSIKPATCNLRFLRTEWARSRCFDLIPDQSTLHFVWAFPLTLFLPLLKHTWRTQRGLQAHMSYSLITYSTRWQQLFLSKSWSSVFGCGYQSHALCACVQLNCPSQDWLCSNHTRLGHGGMLTS